MSKAVLLSIKPKYCELIANGKKTVEVRKTRPKLDTPFKCYIYCTKPSKAHQTICGCMVLNSDELYRHPKQGLKYGDSIELMCCNDEYSKDNFLNGKVIGEFVCDCITGLKCNNLIQAYYNNNTTESCVSDEEVVIYANGKKLYYWHISDLVIYDVPKKLSEFFHACDKAKGTDCSVCVDRRENKCKAITRPPQSWCYVESEE